MKEHFNWKPEYDSEDCIQVDENYDGFIASYQPEGIDHIWDTMVENMDFAEYCGLCMKRPVGAHKIEDSQFHLHQKGFHVPYEGIQEKYNVAETYLNVCNVKYTNFLFMCLDAYCKKFSILEDFNIVPFGIKLQKTRKGQGFHSWHCEQANKQHQQRVLSFMTYLNDDFEGGETEFKYQCKRITPKKGQTLVWPADFTHTHRGLMPLEGTKYIATGWFEFGFD